MAGLLLLTEHTHAQSFTNFTVANISSTLCGNNITAIAIDAHGNKWFGSYGGLSKFNDTTWTTFTTADGLINEWVMSIAIDAKDNKWLGTVCGVSKLSGEGSQGIISLNNNNHLKLYPNPVHDIVYIDLPGQTGTLEVFDITGKSVLQVDVRDDNTSIDVSELDKGIYAVKILSANQIFTGKIVKY